MSSHPALVRRLGTGDAVLLGLGSMVGAGVFVAFAPAAAAAGSGLLVGLAIAAIVAFCNATSSAQLAAQYPTSGGTYVYGRQRLGPWPGFLAGWSFVVGKTASCAAMALTFAAYAAPEGWGKPVAIAGVVALTAVNYFGITRTTAVTRVIVAVVLAILALVLVAGLVSGSPSTEAFDGDSGAPGWYGVIQSAGLLFFAFAGYARLATLGEEVKDPARTIPRAIVTALGITLALYAALAVTALAVLGPERLASSAAPLTEVVTTAGWVWADPVVRGGAAVASLGALLALIAGIGRTGLAMARNRDLPAWFAAVHPRHRVPHHAELALAGVVCVLVLTLDVRGAIGFSSLGVLLYYLVANLSAFTQARPERRYPRALQVVGAGGCVLLVAALPVEAIVGGLVVLAVGIAYRLVVVRMPARR
jgi:APA family basic amino acid/polyamine antiporter